MDVFKAAALNKFEVTGDYRKNLIDLLHTEALEGGVFTEELVLIGMGDFEECFEFPEQARAHYNEYIKHFEEATGKRFLGSFIGEPEATAEDHAPDEHLSTEEYRDALMQTVFDAQSGAWEADDWEIYEPDERADELRLTYAEILAYNAGMNAWVEWLYEMLRIADEDECEAFMDEARGYYEEQFYGFVGDLRNLRKEDELEA